MNIPVFKLIKSSNCVPARKSNHSFPSEEDLTSKLMDNYHPVFMGLPSRHKIYFLNVTEMENEDSYLVLVRLLNIKG